MVVWTLNFPGDTVIAHFIILLVEFLLFTADSEMVQE